MNDPELMAAGGDESTLRITAAVRAGFLPKYPELARYLDQIRAEPGYQRALQKGGPFKLG